ncbi:bile acid:sodium symporter family protein [Natrinema salifodinae]|uniref:Bile acid:Na+ symporter, BASS family/solute carrier family 10 (Sodium/bile acid cotransporter), member 7 n=1 Tax=Natrinema salifodinae TaxID=1202768 RepID=A0A1I0QTW1_9EURY|nr:bile acid:sodium symporter [Natrinema salifodinae]SEW30803.1 bile acid:Na+ symporter, BASS family/solute carrier family 10 (sodium/bile acid cotransporter), member 7 [Natrinema salifodinae]
MVPSAFDRLADQRNVLVVLLSAAAGLLVPGPERYTSILLTPLVIFLVYGSIRGLSLAKVDLGSIGLPVALSLGLGYVLLPLVGLPVAGLVLPDPALTGVAITLAVPTTAGSAIVWTRFSRGDAQLAAIVSIVSILLAPIATPLLLLFLVGHRGGVPVRSILADVLLIVGVAVVLSRAVPDAALSERTTEYGSGVAIACIIYTGVAGADPATVSARTVVGLVAVSVAILGLGLGMAYAAGRYYDLGRRRILPIFFAGSFKNLGIALLIAAGYASGLAVLAIITYYVVEQLTGAVIADLAGSRPGEPEPEPQPRSP